MQDRFLSDNVAKHHREATARLQAKKDEIARADADHQAAGRARPWWKRLLDVESDERLALANRRAKLDEELVDVERRYRELTRGLEGEQVIPERYHTSLDHDWILYYGLCSGTEIDHLLLGPLGIWAIEVKGKRVLLEVDGKKWTMQNLSIAGNLYEKSSATVAGGRTWGQQVAEPAAVLARHLANRGHPVPVNTAVVLVTAGSRTGKLRNTGVDLVTADLEELDRAIADPPGPAVDLDRTEIEAIDEIIVAHHHYHAGHDG